MLLNQYLQKLLWNVQVEDGKKKVKCVGNGNERDLKRKSGKERLREVGSWVSLIV